MATVEKWVPAPVADVWAVLADPRSYAFWVVGSHDIRGVEGDWPQPGARFHHTQGHGPLKISDDTTVLECEAPHRLLMEVRVRPLVVGHVELELRPEREGTCVTMTETAGGGLAGLVPSPFKDPLLALRNTDALRRLAGMAWTRAAALGHTPDDGTPGTTPRSSTRRTNARA